MTAPKISTYISQCAQTINSWKQKNPNLHKMVKLGSIAFEHDVSEKELIVLMEAYKVLEGPDFAQNIKVLAKTAKILSKD
ncbi:MAG: hypothetical protein DRI86_00890 [Bacteroidetes bacterium]|nr:MAG: hypothetical protein DRI86_00890 [Bacteroidota bacterium]